jgi:hypothetical protein
VERKSKPVKAMQPVLMKDFLRETSCQVHSIIPIMDTLKIKLKKIALTYRNDAKIHMLLFYLEASEEQLHEGVIFLAKDYSDDISINLTGKVKELPCFHVYIKQNHGDEGDVYSQNPYLIQLSF